METETLYHYLFTKSEFSSPILLSWMQSSLAFKEFVENEKTKIRGKISNSQKDANWDERSEKLKDLIFELEIAYLLINTNHFHVKYEYYGKKGPDFFVTDGVGNSFNVEVKRIRAQNSPQMRFDIWKNYIRNQISGIKTCLNLYFKFADELTYPDIFIQKLESNTQAIIGFIKQSIKIAEQEILETGNSIYLIEVPEFGEDFTLRFRKPPYSTVTLGFVYGEYPSFQTGEEYLKFDDLYQKAIQQALPDMINILAINTDSKSHDSYSLYLCMYHLDELSKRNDIEIRKLLSGVLFRGAWLSLDSAPNILWEDTEAFKPIPKEISKLLIQMD